MNTFLPYADFAQSAKCLDRQRLGKQRVEALQLLYALVQGPTCVWHQAYGYLRGWAEAPYGYEIRATPWYEHPTARMWRGYEETLVEYGFAICDEWRHVRKYKDTVSGKLTDIMLRCEFSSSNDPAWLGDEAFHAAHRSNLLRKDPVHYGQFGWTEPSYLPYVWPIK